MFEPLSDNGLIEQLESNHSHEIEAQIRAFRGLNVLARRKNPLVAEAKIAVIESLIGASVDKNTMAKCAVRMAVSAPTIP